MPQIESQTLLYSEMWAEGALAGPGASIRIAFGAELYAAPLSGDNGDPPYNKNAFYAEIRLADKCIAIGRFDPLGVIKNQAMFELAELYPASCRGQFQGRVYKLHAATLPGATSIL